MKGRSGARFPPPAPTDRARLEIHQLPSRSGGFPTAAVPARPHPSPFSLKHFWPQGARWRNTEFTEPMTLACSVTCSVAGLRARGEIGLLTLKVHYPAQNQPPPPAAPRPQFGVIPPQKRRRPDPGAASARQPGRASARRRLPPPRIVRFATRGSRARHTSREPLRGKIGERAIRRLGNRPSRRERRLRRLPNAPAIYPLEPPDSTRG